MLLYQCMTLLLLLSTLVKSFYFRGVQLNLTDYRVRATSAYTFYLDRTVDSASGTTPWASNLISTYANITIVFPPSYAGVSRYVCQSLFVDDQMVRNFMCSKIGSQVVVRNFLSNDTYVKRVVLTISAVVNPSIGGQTPNFQGSIGDDIAYPTDSSAVFLVANSFVSCSASFDSAYGNTTSQLTISTLSLNTLATNAYLIITFPYYWTRDAGTQLLRFSPDQPCSFLSNQSTGSRCIGGYDRVGYPMVKIENIGGDLGTTVRLLRVLSPPTNEPVDAIKVQSFQSTDRPVDECQVYPTGITERLISNLVVTPLQTPFPSTPIGLSLTFSLPDTLISADTLYFDFSSSYSPSFAYTNITSPYPLTLLSSYSSAILNFTINRTLATTQSITLQVYTITTPPSIAVVDKFSMGVQLHGYSKMKGYFGFRVQVGIIHNISLIAQVLRVGASTAYLVGFVVPVPIRQSGVVRVYFPDVMQVSSNVRAYCQGIQLSLQLINNTNCVQLTGFSISPTNPITISFMNLTNLMTTTPTPMSIEIKTYRSSSLMDEVCSGSSSSIFQFSASPTLSCQVQSSSRFTGDFGINMTFSISNRFPLERNSTIQITYNQISQSAQSGIGCYVNGVAENCTTDNNVITVHLNNTQVPAAGWVELVVADFFINTPLTKPISYFSLKTFTPAFYLLQYMLGPVYLTNVNQPGPLHYFVLYSRTSSVNSALSTYTFVTYLLQPLQAGSNTLVMTFPQSLSLQQSSCVNCNISLPNTVSFSIGSQFNTLTVGGIRNSLSSQPINNISAVVLLDSAYKYAESDRLGNFITNTQASALNIVGVNYSSFYYGATSTITIRLAGISDQTRQFWVGFPADYQVGGLVCAVNGATLTTSSVLNSTLTVDVTNYTNTNITITLSNVTLPRVNQTLPIMMKTFTLGGHAVAVGELPLWSPRCSLPCYTCTSIPTQCLSCFSDFTISPLTLYNPSTLKCVDQCQQTQINIEQTCVQCSPACRSCSLATNNCTSCGSGSYLHENQCLPNCPASYYRVVVGRYCEHCKQPCETCVSEQQCLTCLAGWFYSGGVCIMSCPADITVRDVVNRVCVSCSPECLTCSSTRSNCTSCNTNFAMENGTCVSQCSSNNYILNNACVPNCSPPCLTCSIYATYCLTCPAQYYLYANTCTTQCPTMYYIRSDNSCQPCSVLAIHCRYCLDQSTCLICDAGYVLFEAQCLNYTPAGYANISGVAELCDDTCLTCDSLVTNCTSCRYDFYHNGVCVASCPDSHFQFNHTCTRCVPPCNNCLNYSACLSCLPTSNRFWLSDTLSCELTCPPFYYANTSVFMCMSCVQPCFTCESRAICTSCMAPTFLYNNRCITACPDGYYQNTTIRACALCLYPCSSCAHDPTNCTTCVADHFYLHPYQCVSNCSLPYITNFEYKVCVNCTEPCLSCSQTTCAKCKNTHTLYNQSCVLSCPSSQYASVMPDGTKECWPCPSECQTCTNQSFCRSCALGYFWQQGETEGSCVQVCPPSRPILEESGCQPCQDENCTACYPNNECFQCLNSSILYEGFCLSECPTGFVYNLSLNSCSLSPPEEKNDTVIVVPPTSEPNLSITIVLPIRMIFCIAGGSLSLFGIMLAWCFGVNMWPLLVCAWSAAEVAALTISTYAYHRYYVYIFIPSKGYGFVMSAALTWLVLINLFVFYYSACKVLLPDSKYRRWKKTASCWQLLFLSFVQTITLLNFKFQHLTWSGITGTPKLESVSKLKYLSVSSALGLVSSISYIVVLILLIYQANQLFLLWLDALIVLALTAFLSGLGLRRSQKFFEEEYEDMILHRRHVSSDEFVSSPMKGTQRQQTYIQTPQERGQKSEVSYIETSSQISSRIQLKSSSRAFLSSSRRQSLNQQSLHSSHQSNPAHATNSSPSKLEVSLQCSILSPGENSHTSNGNSRNTRYFVECEYQNGSKSGVMGSMEQQKAWDGVVHQPEYFKEEYDLNDAVILDNDGKLVQMWDVESNEAVIEDQISSSHKTKANNDSILNLNTNNFLQILDEVQINQVQSHLPSDVQQGQPSHQTDELQQGQDSISIRPIIMEQRAESAKQEPTQIHKYTSILRERLQSESSSLMNSHHAITINPDMNSAHISHNDTITKNNQHMSVHPNESKVNILLDTSNNISMVSYGLPRPSFLQQPNQPSANQSEGDRFDNSVMSNNGGSLSPSSSEYEASALSNHNGSLSPSEFEQHQEYPPEKQQEQQYEQQEEEEEEETIRFDESMGEQGGDEAERWQFLLRVQQEQVLKNTQHNHSADRNIDVSRSHISNNYVAQNQQGNENNQGNQFNRKDEHQNEAEHSQASMARRVIQNRNEFGVQPFDPNSKLQVTNSLIFIQEQNNGNTLVEEQLPIQINTNSLTYTKKSSMSLKKQQLVSDENVKKSIKPNQIEDHGSVGGQQSQQEYLGSKMERKQSKPEDGNKFSIKTKRQKKEEPRHKVVIVESKKFNKLKRQASELQKEIEEGKRLKTLIDYQDAKTWGREDERKSKKRQSKEDELKSIYLNKNESRKV